VKFGAVSLIAERTEEGRREGAEITIRAHVEADFFTGIGDGGFGFGADEGFAR